MLLSLRQVLAMLRQSLGVGGMAAGGFHGLQRGVRYLQLRPGALNNWGAFSSCKVACMLIILQAGVDGGCCKEELQHGVSYLKLRPGGLGI